jgi:chromosome segregation protein
MHLSKLQLLGFKSFPEKTNLVFKRGMTSIVGPNGCGKTNLLDAIRWVLGESRMSVLRGSRLEEIIFAGTKEFKPLGMAEVSLTFDNHDQTVQSGYNEINITRRLFRSGDSEFLINRTPCRLKDITDMFLDTGLGPSAYSVIEQSMVDVLLSDKTEDRRFLFEEAAGITKYKQRKRQAIRKLDATEADLLRLQDVLAEVGSQVSSLRRQVSKAERHRSLLEDIKRTGVSLSSAEWRRLEESELRLSRDLDDARSKTESLSANEKQLELERENISLTRAEKEQSLRDVQSELERAVGKCHNLENELSVLKEKVRSSRELFAQAGQDIDSLQRRRDSLDDEIEENEREQDEAGRHINTLNSELSGKESEYEQRLQRFRSVKEQLESNLSALAELNDRLTAKRENQLSLDLRYGSDSRKLSELDDDIDRLKQDIERVSSQREEKTAAASEINSSLDITKSDLENSLSEKAGHEDALGTIDERSRQLDSKLDRVNGRSEFLESVVSEYEGYGPGAAALGRIKEEIPGVLDTVANLVQTDSENSRLIQAVLGEYASFFVVEDSNVAAKVIERVRDEKLGRVGLIIKSKAKELSAHRDSRDAVDYAPVRSLVRGDDDLSEVLDFLFADHYLCESFSESLPDGFADCNLWTREGELTASGGMVLAAGLHEIVLVGRKQEIETLAADRQEIVSELDSLGCERAIEVEKLERVSLRIDELELKLNETEKLSSEIRVELAGCEYELASLERQRAEKNRARNELAAALESISRDKGEIGGELELLRGQSGEMEQEVERLKTETAETEQLSTDSERESNRLRMELVGAEGQLDTLRSNHQRMTELRTDIVETLATRERQQSEYLATAVDCRRSIREGEADIKSRYENVETRRAGVIAINSEISEFDDKLSVLDGDLKNLRRELNGFRESMHKLDLEFSSVRSRKTSHVQDSIEHYEFDPSKSSMQVELSDEQRADMEEELAKLRQRLDAIGPVNMLALDEYEEQHKRHQFLDEQVGDLISAKDDLKSTITRINTTARRLFGETLEQVRENFKEIFQELFEGGDADVRLEEGVDPLEANIIIKARPRGKKILSIQQLSGGERALTSISLLFSLYLVKPSPFCVLDEVDAPLDDANIGRFLRMIRKFSESTQFIIITHNKITMEAADILYGVTMEKPGVSQIVSVNLDDIDDIDPLIDGNKTVNAEEVVGSEA